MYQQLGQETKAYLCLWQVVALNPQNEYGAFGRGVKLTQSISDRYAELQAVEGSVAQARAEALEKVNSESLT